jgi:hypothetical protein
MVSPDGELRVTDNVNVITVGNDEEVWEFAGKFGQNAMD